MQIPLGFIKCPKCQKFSLNIEPSLGLFGQEKADERQIIEWECPSCFNIISEEEWKKNIVLELDEEAEKKQRDFHLGHILAYIPGEITPAKAKELAVEYVKNLNREKPPLFFKNIRVVDNNEEWQINFDEIALKDEKTLLADYFVVVNKKTGELNQVSFF